MSDEQSITSLLEKQISTLESNLNRRLDATEKNMGERMDRQDQSLGRIEGKVDKTNGRVTALEKVRERGLGVIAAYRWIPIVVASCLSAGLVLLGTALSGGFH